MLSYCQYTGNVTLDAYRLLIADVYELAGASRRTSDDLARTSGQTAARWHVLSALSGGPRTVPSTARRLGLAPQSVQRVVDDLVRAGQLAAKANPDHVRSPLFELTEAGRATLAELFARSDRQRGEMLARAGLTARQLDEARTVIRTLVAAIQRRGGG
jgi:DNA-binding MarR family transcriptional regulator